MDPTHGLWNIGLVGMGVLEPLGSQADPPNQPLLPEGVPTPTVGEILVCLLPQLDLEALFPPVVVREPPPDPLHVPTPELPWEPLSDLGCGGGPERDDKVLPPTVMRAVVEEDECCARVRSSRRRSLRTPRNVRNGWLQ